MDAQINPISKKWKQNNMFKQSQKYMQISSTGPGRGRSARDPRWGFWGVPFSTFSTTQYHLPTVAVQIRSVQILAVHILAQYKKLQVYRYRYQQRNRDTDKQADTRTGIHERQGKQVNQRNADKNARRKCHSVRTVQYKPTETKREQANRQECHSSWHAVAQSAVADN